MKANYLQFSSQVSSTAIIFFKLKLYAKKLLKLLNFFLLNFDFYFMLTFNTRKNQTLYVEKIFL